MWSRNCFPFHSTWVHLRFLVRFVFLNLNFCRSLFVLYLLVIVLSVLDWHIKCQIQSSSCFTCGTRRVTLVTNQAITDQLHGSFHFLNDNLISWSYRDLPLSTTMSIFINTVTLETQINQWILVYNKYVNYKLDFHKTIRSPLACFVNFNEQYIEI
jgi:hypothetical protein